MCTCSDSVVECTQVVCPPKNCISSVTNRAQSCEEIGSRCTEMKNVSCLREPCPRFGQCMVEGKTQASRHQECGPATNYVSDDCVKVHLVFWKKKLPPVRFVTSTGLLCRVLSF